MSDPISVVPLHEATIPDRGHDARSSVPPRRAQSSITSDIELAASGRRMSSRQNAPPWQLSATESSTIAVRSLAVDVSGAAEMGVIRG